MSETNLERIEADIGQLSLAEQLWLMERLAQRIRRQALPIEPDFESQLAAMASDPDIQRELRQIEAEFAVTDDVSQLIHHDTPQLAIPSRTFSPHVSQ